MTAPTPAQYERLLDELFSVSSSRRWRKVLLESYKWTVGPSLERAVVEEAKIRSTSPNTPVETIAASKAHIRRAQDRATRNVNHAISDLRDAIRACDQALETLDPPARPEPLRYPRTVSNAELEEARDARERRKEMGEAIP